MKAEEQGREQERGEAERRKTHLVAVQHAEAHGREEDQEEGAAHVGEHEAKVPADGALGPLDAHLEGAEEKGENGDVDGQEGLRDREVDAGLLGLHEDEDAGRSEQDRITEVQDSQEQAGVLDRELREATRQEAEKVHDAPPDRLEAHPEVVADATRRPLGGGNSSCLGHRCKRAV